MANLIKGTKTITGGTDGFVVPDATYGFQRQANIGISWKKIRIGLIISPTSNSALNAQPPDEEITPTSNLNTHFILGITNGVSSPGNAGNRFVGAEMYGGGWGTKTAIKTYSGGAQWALNAGGGYGIQYLPLRGIFGDGTSTAVTDGKIDFNGTSVDNTGTSDFGLMIVLELDITTDGVLAISGNVVTAVSDMSDANLVSNMQASLFSLGTQTGGWWSSSVDAGLQYLYFRTPFINSRMRIHNSAILQLA